MKNIRILMVTLGFALISPYASSETMDSAEADAGSETTMQDEKPATMDEAMPEGKTETKAEEAAAPAEDEPVADASGNLVSTCKNGSAVRVITVIYDNPETDTVCEVSYEKASGTQELWSANNDRNYCLEKAQAFVEKQKGWGWDCSDLK